MFFAILLLCVFFASHSLFAQDDSYKSNHDFKEAWREAETEKLSKDRYTAYRRANEIAQNRCNECIIKAMQIVFDRHHYDEAGEAAKVLQEMPTASKREQATGAVYEGLSVLHEDMENAGQNDLLKAESLFRKAVKTDPTYGTGLYELGRVLVPLRNLPEAKEMFHKAIVSDDLNNLYKLRSQLFIEYPDWAPLNMLPNFSAHTTEGQLLNTAELEGKVTLFVFPAYHNGYNFLKSDPFPTLEEIARKLKDEPFQIITVFWGTHADEGSKFLKKHPLPWLSLTDPTNDLAYRLMPSNPFPSYIVADMRSVVVTKTHIKSEDLERYLRQIIEMNKKVLGSSLAQPQK